MLGVHVGALTSFGDVSPNPAELMLSLARNRDSLLTRNTLTVTAESCDRFIGNATAFAPAWYLVLGVNMCSRRVVLERSYQNTRCFEVESGEFCEPELIRQPGSLLVSTCVSVDQVCCHLQAGGWEVEGGSNAGTYLCNYVGYQACNELQPGGSKVWFVHVANPTHLGLDRQVQIVERVIDLITQAIHLH